MGNEQQPQAPAQTTSAQTSPAPSSGQSAPAPQRSQSGGQRGGQFGQRSGGGGGQRGGGQRGGGGGRGGHGGRGDRRREPSEFEEEVLQIARVTRVVKGGRRLRFRATVIVGNRKGKVGLGIGKSNEVIGAISKAISKAKREMIEVPIVNETIPHELKMKYKSARILLMPARPGTGIIAGGAVRKIAELAGIKNILSKIIGANNRVTNAQATMIALKQLRKVPAKVSTVK